MLPNTFPYSTIPRLQREETQLLIVDVQEKLLPVIHQGEEVARRCALLARAAQQLQIPVIVTEQYPEKLGATVAQIREIVGSEAISKMRFSSCVESTCSALEQNARSTVLLCGIETHVCVLQTALDLCEQGYTVFAALDAISSRREADRQLGWERMKSIGVVPTSAESAVFELLGEAGTPDFKALLPHIK